MPGLIEILIIVALVVFLFGYKRFPKLGKSLGIGATEFKKSFREAAGLPDSESEPDEKIEKG